MQAVLEAYQGATSVNCGVATLGRAQKVVPGHDYAADSVTRLLEKLVGDQVPCAAAQSLLLNAAILAVGPAVAHPENLYVRWLRDLALTSPAAPAPFAELCRVWRRNLVRFRSFLEGGLPQDAAGVRW